MIYFCLTYLIKYVYIQTELDFVIQYKLKLTYLLGTVNMIV